jgi:hypothetical protein
MKARDEHSNNNYINYRSKFHYIRCEGLVYKCSRAGAPHPGWCVFSDRRGAGDGVGAWRALNPFQSMQFVATHIYVLSFLPVVHNSVSKKYVRNKVRLLIHVHMGYFNTR